MEVMTITDLTPKSGIDTARRINREGELRLPRDRGPGATVPALGVQHLRPGQSCWWETPYGQWRARMEGVAMNRFPQFRLLRHDDHLHWVGHLKVCVQVPEGVRARRYLIRVTYPLRFPHDPPTVTIERPRPPVGAPHQIAPQQPCLYDPHAGSAHGYDRARTTAATLVSWTALWLHALEVWRLTGDWPGAEL